MRKICLLLLFVATFNLGWSQQLNDIYKKLEAIAVIDQKVMMPMRDGVKLATDIYRPKGDAKVPIVFSRTPYNFNTWGDGEMRTRGLEAAYDAVQRGYAYVVQNERGRFFSEGQWDILGTPTTDGYDAFEWMSKQSWSNGKIGVIGCSSTAEWQMAVASLNHPALAAMVAQGFGAGVGRVGEFYEQGNWFRGGAQQMLFTSWLYGTQNDAFRPTFPKDITQADLVRVQRFYDMATEMPKVDWAQALRHLPVQDIIKNVNGQKGIYEDMIRRKPNDPAWFKGGLYHDTMPMNVPAYWFVSWYDVSASPNLTLFNQMRKNPNKEIADNQYLVIAPTLHCAYKRATENTVVGERSMGDARLNYDELTWGWFDMLLKGEANDFKKNTARVKYFTMGSNTWQTSETWPPAKAVMTDYFLSSEGKANTSNGNGKLVAKIPSSDKPDAFSYDPANPVSSYGGNVCCTGNAVTGGAFDQSQMELRDDMLVYTSEPLKEGMEVSGFIESTLYLSSDVKDTDVTIKLIDVYPDGKAYNLDETIQRVRYREGYEKEVWMEKGNVYKVKLSPMSTSNFFAAGHRVRIEVAGSNFPRFERNLNTGGNNFDESVGVVAHTQIHHSKKYPSVVRLPIVKK
ncbi:MAG: CocE/NonD family hydrolase [Cytophagales bacterium]|jgi:putative CocE/NonD family hydrolase|nr:CocE/NonD family hydrolase [Cytophagales bacterium]MCA6499019.1 CocE/NonD family hydrolase [Chitinophagaceae bacterium]MCA6388149.1 CocE/NonD family hydrolase [Cytophagales bacterium]MCA6392709.1 CocE/NonD family hydrolase [Cytophagales bacterium]MCA6396737.1 CocE/NonD family hydrolase [Cytophagales bacterium]